MSRGWRSEQACSFEDLEVFKRAYRVSLEVASGEPGHAARSSNLRWPIRCDGLRSPICANIAEGYGRQHRSKAEFKRFLWMAVGSADEMRVWARYALDLGYVDEQTWRKWRDEYQIISRHAARLWPASREASP